MWDKSVTGVCPGGSLSSCRGVAVALSGGDASREFFGAGRRGEWHEPRIGLDSRNEGSGPRRFAPLGLWWSGPEPMPWEWRASEKGRKAVPAGR